jgi:hypothetical protein
VPIIPVPEATTIKIRDQAFALDLLEAVQKTDEIRKTTQDRQDWTWLDQWQAYLTEKAGFEIRREEADYLWDAVGATFLEQKKNRQRGIDSGPNSPSSTESTPST